MSVWDKWKEKLQKATTNLKSWIENAKTKQQTLSAKAKAPTQTTDATTAATNVETRQIEEKSAANPQVAPITEATTPVTQPTQPVEPTQPTQPTQPTEQVAQASSQTDDRFLNWYKEKFGRDFNEENFNKAEGMSDKDYEVGNNLYQAYIQKQNLQNQLNSANEQIDSSKAKQRQEASVLRDKMAKYLALQNKNNGLNNLGVSESVGLQADSQYMNNLGSIEANANAEKTNLLNNYLNNKTDIDTQAAQNEQNILNKYQQYAREDEQEAYERQKYEEERDYQREQDKYSKDTYEKEKEEQKEQADKDNAYVVAQTTLEELIANRDYGKAKQYLEDNKNVFGENVYNTYSSQIGQSEISDTTEAQTEEVSNFLLGSAGSVSDTYAKYKDIMANLESKHSQGLISDNDYDNLVKQMNSTTSNKCNGGWYVQGLGSGRENDDIDITIGSTSRKGNGATEYDLLCGSTVTDEEIKKQLNKLATGDESKNPGARTDGWAWLFGDGANSSSSNGRLVVFMNQMFIYTSKGWTTVKGDHSDIQKAINAYLGK